MLKDKPKSYLNVLMAKAIVKYLIKGLMVAIGAGVLWWATSVYNRPEPRVSSFFYRACTVEDNVRYYCVYLSSSDGETLMSEPLTRRDAYDIITSMNRTMEYYWHDK